MATHAMIDIETLGTEPTSVILSVGGVKFDPFTSIEINLFALDESILSKNSFSVDLTIGIMFIGNSDNISKREIEKKL